MARHNTNDTTPPPHSDSDTVRIALWDRVNRTNDRIDDIESAIMIAIGADGKNGKLSAVEKRLDGARTLLITLVIASISLVATVFASWISMSERVARMEASQEIVMKQCKLKGE